MPKPFPHAYTHSHTVSEDGQVWFKCIQDVRIWPWLALNPTHPILVQTINFWGSVECGEALGTFDPEKWSALTECEWTCGAADTGLPVRGIYETLQRGDKIRYQLRFFDGADALVVRISGRGVVFRTRNFEGWREEAKENFTKPDIGGFIYAPADAVSVGTQSESFLAPLARGTQVSTTGLITHKNGLRPAHPYIGGSGDHVNSTHMGEVGRQFGELLVGEPLINRGGEMKFLHYVELGRPFDAELVSHDEAECRFSLRVRQRNRECTQISMAYAKANSRIYRGQ
ncbi:MAG: hypothetical protein AAFR82_02305 [Pseudomonadota bacterium]